MDTKIFQFWGHIVLNKCVEFTTDNKNFIYARKKRGCAVLITFCAKFSYIDTLLLLTKSKTQWSQSDKKVYLGNLKNECESKLKA